VALVGYAKEGEQTRLTLWEQAGSGERELEITVPGMNPIQVRPIDLRGEAIEDPTDRPKVASDGKVTAVLDAHAPLCLELNAE
jgi:hypothetical protein